MSTLTNEQRTRAILIKASTADLHACIRGYARLDNDAARQLVDMASEALTVRDCPRDSFGNYDPSDALLDHLDDQPAPVGTSRRTTLNSPVGYVALEHES